MKAVKFLFLFIFFGMLLVSCGKDIKKQTSDSSVRYLDLRGEEVFWTYVDYGKDGKVDMVSRTAKDMEKRRFINSPDMSWNIVSYSQERCDENNYYNSMGSRNFMGQYIEGPTEFDVPRGSHKASNFQRKFEEVMESY
jgi:hypothetical protein